MPGMTVLVAAGEQIGVDGVVVAGVSEVDSSLLTGDVAKTGDVKVLFLPAP